VIVVDTNVVAYLWLPGSDTPHAERLLRADPDWCVPLLWRSEFRSVLTGLVRRKRMSLDAATRTASDVERQLSGREYAVPADRVLRTAVDSGCSSYDCEFVVLATLLGVPLVTADRQVLRSFPDVAVSLSDALHER
jgi:predicted nucleic acid-binding protein